MSNRTRKKRLSSYDRGFTLFELLTVVSLLAIVTGIAITNLRTMSKPITNAAVSTEQFLQLARSRAISGTEIYRVEAESDSRIIALKGTSCELSDTPVSDMILDFQNGAKMLDTSWFVCFNARGRADASISFQISDNDGRAKTIRVALGGGVKIDK